MDSEQAQSQPALAGALSKLDAVKDILTVKRAFGDPYELDGAMVIPVAAVRGGGGGGGGEGDATDGQGTGSGGGMGFGVNVRPVGVFVTRDGAVTWVPSVDVMRIVFGGQLVVVAGILVLGRVFTHRRRHRR